MRDLNIAAGEAVAFCHSLNGVSGARPTAFAKLDGRWLVTHGHSSEPFDMKSGKALLDLRP